jgi:arabinofuranan 3-O-arabinosyltransferase
VDGVRRVLQVPQLKGSAVPNATRSVRISFPRVTGSHIRIEVDKLDKVFQRRYGGAQRVLAPVAIAEFGIPGLHGAKPSTRLDSGCRDDLLRLDGKPVAVRITGPASDAGVTNGLAVSSCGGPLRLSAGRHQLDTARGGAAAFSLDRIVLASGSAATPVRAKDGHVQPFATPPTGTPRVDVVGQGSTHVRVHVSGATGPFWLVLGQSQSPGWRARIVGKSGLGGSALVDGYANGWLITPRSSTFDVAMDWTPQRQVWIAIWLTIAFMLLCIAIIVVTWRRRLAFTAREGDADATVEWRGFTPLAGRARWTAVAVSAALAAVMVTPWVGLLIGAATIALTARTRRFALLLPAALLALCGVYIVAEQAIHHFPSVFEWPTLFPHAPTAAWIAVAILAADGIVEIVRRSTSATTETEPSTDEN